MTFVPGREPSLPPLPSRVIPYNSSLPTSSPNHTTPFAGLPQSAHPQVTPPLFSHPQVNHPQFSHPRARHPQVSHPQVRHPQVNYPYAAGQQQTHLPPAGYPGNQPLSNPFQAHPSRPGLPATQTPPSQAQTNQYQSMQTPNNQSEATRPQTNQDQVDPNEAKPPANDPSSSSQSPAGDDLLTPESSASPNPPAAKGTKSAAKATKSAAKRTKTGRVTKPSQRSHEENQERAYIAASRRADRSLEARVESARAASRIHKERTGRSLRITEQAVANEEMYEEEDDDYDSHFRRLSAHLTAGSGLFHLKLGDYIQTQLMTRQAFMSPNGIANLGAGLAPPVPGLQTAGNFNLSAFNAAQANLGQFNGNQNPHMFLPPNQMNTPVQMPQHHAHMHGANGQTHGLPMYAAGPYHQQPRPAPGQFPASAPTPVPSGPRLPGQHSFGQHPAPLNLHRAPAAQSRYQPPVSDMSPVTEAVSAMHISSPQPQFSNTGPSNGTATMPPPMTSSMQGTSIPRVHIPEGPVIDCSLALNDQQLFGHALDPNHPNTPFLMQGSGNYPQPQSGPFGLLPSRPAPPKAKSTTATEPKFESSGMHPSLPPPTKTTTTPSPACASANSPDVVNNIQEKEDVEMAGSQSPQHQSEFHTENDAAFYPNEHYLDFEVDLPQPEVNYGEFLYFNEEGT